MLELARPSFARVARRCAGLLAAAVLFGIPSSAHAGAQVFPIQHDAFSHPSALAVGPDGSIWAAHGTPLNAPRYSNAIARLHPSGRHRLIRVPTSTTSITVLRNGTVVALGATRKLILLVSPRGRVRQIKVPGGQDQTLKQVVTGPDGNAWALISNFEGEGRLIRVTSAGQATTFRLPQTQRPNTDPIDPSPDSIAVGPDGRLWITVVGAVVAVTTDGEFTTYPLPDLPTSDGFGLPVGPRSIIAGPDRALWIARDDGALDRMRTDGTLLPPVQVPGRSELADAIGTGPGGDVFVAKRNSLYRLKPSGVVDTVTLKARDYRSTFWASPEGSRGQFVAGPGGTLWFSAVLTEVGSTGGIAVVNFRERCFVPDLQLMRPAEARKELRLHGCRLGRVRRTEKASRLDAVQCASAKPGRILRRHARIDVTVHPFASRERRGC